MEQAAFRRSELATLWAERPPVAWRERAQEQAAFGGQVFWLDAALEGAEKILLDFLTRLDRLESPSVEAVKSIARDALVAFNQLNERFNPTPIETLERDDLGVFMERAINAVGVNFPDFDDWTLEHREW